LNNLTPRRILNPVPFPPREIRMVASDLICQLAEYSWYGRVKYHIMEGEWRCQHLEGSICAMKMEIKEIKATNKKLKKAVAEEKAYWKIRHDTRVEFNKARKQQEELKETLRKLKQDNVAPRRHAGSQEPQTNTTRVPSQSMPFLFGV
jgi:hypothetical protein